ncbi:MAG TPA: Na+/H+ antiporter [Acetobacteraceae bacterium]|nr:Na+/H+ antiporter [Acetobacteraceae bacterium]
MPFELALGFVLVAITAFAAVVARRLWVPHSILLVVLGVALAFVPGLPRVTIDPELVLLLLLPPLLYSSGVGMSWRGFRSNLRPILLLAVGCVLFTAAAVAAATHILFGLSWALGFVLGAVVSPPDSVAPMAIARRLAVPSRVLTVLEGEGLVNDATALILFSFAVAAVVKGGVSITDAALSFVVIVGGEMAWGLCVGWGLLRMRYLVCDPQVEIVLALLTPYVAFWPPHLLHGSGVLATVAAGLYVSWNGPRFIAPATRLQGFFVWGLVVYLIEGVMFLLTGLQAHVVASGITDGDWRRLVWAGLLTSAVVVLVRFVWVFPATYLPRWASARLRARDPLPPWQLPFMIGFTGIRGGVSVAAALSIPLVAGAAPFPDRDLVLFATFCVILVTLVGQGTALPWVIVWLGLADAGRAEAAEAKRREVEARIAGIDAVLARLDAVEREGAFPEAARILRELHQERRAEFVGTADETVPGSPVADVAALQLQLIEAERRALAQLYARDGVTDEARRRIERELDLEDARTRHAAESATGDDVQADPSMGGEAA